MTSTLQLLVVAIISGSFAALLAFFISILSQRSYFKEAVTIALKTHIHIHHKKSIDELENYVDDKIKEPKEEIKNLERKLENIDKVLTWLAYKDGAKPKDLDINI